jgi:hypothetical protein
VTSEQGRVVVVDGRTVVEVDPLTVVVVDCRRVVVVDGNRCNDVVVDAMNGSVRNSRAEGASNLLKSLLTIPAVKATDPTKKLATIARVAIPQPSPLLSADVGAAGGLGDEG